MTNYEYIESYITPGNKIVTHYFACGSAGPFGISFMHGEKVDTIHSTFKPDTDGERGLIEAVETFNLPKEAKQ